MVVFDGQTVTIRRAGGLGGLGLVGRGEQQVPVGQLGCVEYKAPGRITGEGFIRFLVAGTVARRYRPGQRNNDARTDEWAVTFRRKEQHVFEQLRDEIQRAIAARHQTGPSATPAQPALADELTKLTNLRNSGALTDTEFAAAKAKLLG